MIKITQLEILDDHRVLLTFNDHQAGIYDAAPLLARDTVLTRPLQEPAYFARAFLELGALCWPNGLELSPSAIHRELTDAGVLSPRPRVA